MSTAIETQEIPSKYNKRIEDLIEDAEIEAELEAERHIRIKNAKWMLISSVGLIALGILYFWSDSQPNAQVLQPVSAINETAQLSQEPEIKPIPFAVEDAKSSSNSKTSDLVSELEALEKKQIDPPVKPLKTDLTKLNSEPARSVVTEKTEYQIGVPLNEISTPTPLVNLLKKVVSKKEITSKNKQNQKSKPKVTIQEASYSIQLGAFSVKENAKDFVKKIQKKGIKPIIDVRQANKITYSVITGEFNNKESGKAALEGLKKAGFKPTLEEKTSGQYSLIAGSFTSQNKAQKLRSELTNKGFLSSVSSQESQQTTYAVQFGAFSNLKQAKSSQTELSQLGIAKTFIKKIG
jgi:cell division protein FtsN